VRDKGAELYCILEIICTRRVSCDVRQYEDCSAAVVKRLVCMAASATRSGASDVTVCIEKNGSKRCDIMTIKLDCTLQTIHGTNVGTGTRRLEDGEQLPHPSALDDFLARV
jgi:hypothetical protein